MAGRGQGRDPRRTQENRLMRAATNKPKIAKFEGCYHGWHDYAQWNVFVDPETMGPEDRPNMTPGSGGIPDGAREWRFLLLRCCL